VNSSKLMCGVKDAQRVRREEDGKSSASRERRLALQRRVENPVRRRG